MHINNLLLIDADQFPLGHYFSAEELDYSYVIASSNNHHNLVKNNIYYGGETPSFAEAADTYLVLALEDALKNHSIDKITAATKDKKLMYMLINIVAWKNIKCPFIAHPHCQMISDKCVCEGIDFYHLSGHNSNYGKTLEHELTIHLRGYPLGLKFKTLARHFGMSRQYERLTRALDSLISKGEVACYNDVYFAHQPDTYQ
ncbi:hypothetical protein BCU68_12190 [Vibrio sp. 10N.286.49.B3]|uniref:hypothetical protein n=1 Tax=Vibrio sp. 10N.286.49.B3 TaxID=1880855 RepID=UPI000C81FF30|nr:hypothetical protein [Vibrio sp. 10N.286.49.B3]PMH44895.1 hypothetical protein BCU68_12190 [Vibrio sp. 10N.286.49.B3]